MSTETRPRIAPRPWHRSDKEAQILEVSQFLQKQAAIIGCIGPRFETTVTWDDDGKAVTFRFAMPTPDR